MAPQGSDLGPGSPTGSLFFDGACLWPEGNMKHSTQNKVLNHMCLSSMSVYVLNCTHCSCTLCGNIWVYDGLCNNGSTVYPKSTDESSYSPIKINKHMIFAWLPQVSHSYIFCTLSESHQRSRKAQGITAWIWGTWPRKDGHQITASVTQWFCW